MENVFVSYLSMSKKLKILMDTVIHYLMFI